MLFNVLMSFTVRYKNLPILTRIAVRSPAEALKDDEPGS